MTTTEIKKVNIYRANGEWCYAAWTAEGFDHSDTLNAATEAEAEAEVAAIFQGAKVVRVSDI